MSRLISPVVLVILVILVIPFMSDSRDFVVRAVGVTERGALRLTLARALSDRTLVQLGVDSPRHISSSAWETHARGRNEAIDWQTIHARARGVARGRARERFVTRAPA
jgi:hypothetical protein